MEKRIKELFNDTILEKALKYYGFKKEEVVNKAGFESFIFEINHDSELYILRISHSIHRKLELIEAEIEFIYYLSNNNSNVSTPIKSLNDKLVEKILLEDDSYFSTKLFTKAKGKQITPKQYSKKLFENLGEAIGDLHVLAKKYVPKHKRYSYFEDSYILSFSDYLPADKKFIVDKFKILFEKLKKHPQNNSNYGLCHSDLHFGNIFVTEDLELTFFDFDDSMYTHYAFDIAIVFFYALVFGSEERTYDDRSRMFKEYYPEFLKGYNKNFSIRNEDISLIKDYIIVRAYDLYAVFHRSFDLSKNQQVKNIVDYLEDVIVNDTPIFDYSLIERLTE